MVKPQKRLQLTLTHKAELKWLRQWMQKDVPARLTTSQVVDSVIVIVHEWATNTTSRMFHIPKLYAALQDIWMRATVQAVGRVLAGLGIDCDVKFDPASRQLVVTRLSDGRTVSYEALTDGQIEEAMRAAEPAGRSPSTLRVH